MQRSYFINSRCLGSADETLLDEWDDPFLWFCVACGEVYARAVCDGEPMRDRAWRPHAGCCERCRPPAGFENMIPGSVWSYRDKQNEYLPIEVLRRELLLTIKQVEGEENGR